MAMPSELNKEKSSASFPTPAATPNPRRGAKTRGHPKGRPKGGKERKPPQAENPEQGTRPRKARGPEAPRAAPPDQEEATRRPPPPRREGAPQATPTQEKRRTRRGEDNKIETGKNPLYQC